MSYDIQVYPLALKQKTEAQNLSFHQALDFIEDVDYLIPFTVEQIELIEEHLKRRAYLLVRKSENRNDYEHSKYPSVSAMLTPTGLYFNARGEDVMEISMTAGEFTYYNKLDGEFEVMDTQNNGWQK